METTGAVEQHLVDRLTILADEECDRVCDDVYGLRDHWTHRHDKRPFYTLGTPSYLDATRKRFGTYSEAAQRLNPLMVERFGWLYSKLDEALASAGYGPIVPDDRLAYPGFHIFLGDGETRPTPPSVHYDLQYQHIDWSPYQLVDVTCPLSYTLALRLPSGGSGLFVWDVDVHAVQQMPEADRRAHLLDRRQSTYQPYKAGDMVVHNGHYLHQIARLADMQPGDARVTLQGHAVRTERGWINYW